MPLFAGGVAAFGVAALVLSFVRRTKKKLTRRPEIDSPDHKRKTWRRELGDDLKNVWITASSRERKETFVNPIDVWAPSDLERGLERIPGPPSILEMDDMDGVEESAMRRKSGSKTFMNPIDVWKPSDLGIDDIDGVQDAVMISMESPDDNGENMDFVLEEEVVKLEPREQGEEMDVSPVPSSEPSSGEPLVCIYPGCKVLDIFPNRGALKHHARYHIKNNFCPHCDSSFAVPKDLKRHIVSKHTPKDAKKVWFCTVHGCKNAKLPMPRAGIVRKDNWQRHMRVSHGKSNREVAALEAEAVGDA